jgi:hypothetical protein
MTMTDAEMDAGGRFGAIDPKLTVFALANGVDLVRSDGQRRLEWFSDGFERGILIVADGDDDFAVALLKWQASDPEGAEPHDFREGVAVADLMPLLDEAIESANEL